MSDEQIAAGRPASEIDPASANERFVYQVEQGTWQQMAAELLHEATFDVTVEVAAARLGLTVVEFEAWLRWSRGRNGRAQAQAAYLVAVGPWRQMIDDLLLTIVADMGSVRATAKLLSVPRSTLAAWVRGARARLTHRTTRWGYPIEP